MRKFYIHNVFPNCPRISMDCQRIHDYLTANGFTFTGNMREADIAIVSFCSITADMENKSVSEAVYHLKKIKSPTKILMLECTQGINKYLLEGDLKDLPRITTADMELLDSLIKAGKPFSFIPEPNKIRSFSSSLAAITLDKLIAGIKNPGFLGMFSRFMENRKTIKDRFLSERIYYIRISKGCYGKCAFCVMSACRLSHTSRRLENIIREFRQGLEEGYRTFMLVAHDTGSYGIDLGFNVEKLLEEIFKIEGDYRLILVDFGVEWFIKYFTNLKALFVKNHRKIHRLALAVQSGSDEIIRSMNRRYSRSEVIDCLLQLKNALPGYHRKVSIQIMVGFPGEREEDFEKTLDLVRRIELPIVNIFAFSPRPQTQAYSMEPKLDEETIKKRIDRLAKTRGSFK